MKPAKKAYNQDRVKEIKIAVKQLYLERNPKRTQWADWLFENHIFVVSDYASKLADKYGANKELCEISAMMHDIADAVMSRFDPDHQQKSLKMAQEIMEAQGYDDESINIVINDCLPFHGCRGDERPKTLEGRVLATADALAHLQTDFFMFTTYMLASEMSFSEIKAWTLKKLEKSFNKKMLFADEKQLALKDYQLLKMLFS
jgi:putative nucleotidyltransferase with HDIG domain